MIRKIIIIVGLLLFTPASQAIPVVYDAAYRIELLTTVSGTAINALALNSSGDLYATGYNTGNVLVIASPASSGPHTATEYATGMPFATGMTITDDGRLFVSSSTGASSLIYQVFADGSTSIFSTGYSYPTSMTSFNDDLFVSNSGNGTISKIDGSTGVSTTLASGTGTPYGLSVNGTGLLYFTDHGSGNIFSSDQNSNLTLLGALTPFGVGYTGVSSLGELFISDIITAEIYKIDAGGNMSLFASGFAGKNNAPFNGPHDYAFDGAGNMYVSDADSIWRITAVPLPPALWLFSSALIGLMGFAVNNPN